MSEKKNTLLQWHPVFYASIQIEFEAKSDTVKVSEIPADEITISFVCSKFPQNLIQHLENERKYSIEKQESGVYYVKGDIFPIQIIHTKKLSEESNFWLHNLTNDIKQKNDVQKIIAEYQKHNADKLYSSVMNIIVTANRNRFKEVTNMCEALEELFMEKHREAFEKEKQAAVQAAIAEQTATITEQTATITEQTATIAELHAEIKRLKNQS